MEVRLSHYYVSIALCSYPAVYRCRSLCRFSALRRLALLDNRSRTDHCQHGLLIVYPASEDPFVAGSDA